MKIFTLREATVPDFSDFLEKNSHRKFIFFDTETTGTNRIQKDNTKNQLLQISAISYDLKFDNLGILTFNEVDRFDEKIRLSEETISYIQKEPPAPSDPRQYDFWLKTTKLGLIIYTHYDIYNSNSFVDESTAITNFENFIKKYDNPILIAHNAPFDVKWLQFDNFFVDSKYMVIDTCEYFNYLFFPELQHQSLLNEEYQIQYDRFANTKNNKKSVKLKNLIEGFHNEENKLRDKLITHHNSLTDCELTKDVFEKSLRIMCNIYFY